MNGLEKQIAAAIVACEKAADSPKASGYLPSVIASLRAMNDVLRRKGEKASTARRRAAGLFRIVSDDERLLTSPLGDRLVSVINDFREAMTERSEASNSPGIFTSVSVGAFQAEKGAGAPAKTYVSPARRLASSKSARPR